MPELPDLLYIQKYLRKHVCGRTITAVSVKQPIVLRVALDEAFDTALMGKRIETCELRGPFLRLALSDDRDLVLNLMLAGKLQHQKPNDKPEGFLCFSLTLEDGSKLNLCDEQKMAKAYIVARGSTTFIPKYDEQGVGVLSGEFTLSLFKQLAAAHAGKQVRVFINDQTILSSIGNAYADEILFEARIHPKTFVRTLSDEEVERLYHAIGSVLQWGIAAVEQAAQPIHVKVRTHMRVRNRRGKPCPRCGTTIRREGVRGFDVFFCPTCQPPSRRHFLQWNSQHQP
jgi:formamidopyrimidine-DNA glycosylase